MRALHMLKLGEVAGADAERRTLGSWSARRVVGLVGLRGLFLDGGAQSYRAAGQVWGHKPGWLGAHPCELGAQPAAGWWVWWVWWVSWACFGPNARGEIASGAGAWLIRRGGISVPNWGQIRPPRGGFGGFQGAVLARWRAENRPGAALGHGGI